MIVIGGVLSQLVLAQATPWFAEIAETAVYKMSRIRMLIARGHHHDFFVLTMGLISHSRYPGPGGRNSTRKGKTLWANADDKDPVVGITAFPFKRSIKIRKVEAAMCALALQVCALDDPLAVRRVDDRVTEVIVRNRRTDRNPLVRSVHREPI